MMAYDLTASPVDLQNILNNQFTTDIDVGSKVTPPGVFDFWAFLNSEGVGHE